MILGMHDVFAVYASLADTETETTEWHSVILEEIYLLEKFKMAAVGKLSFRILTSVI